MEQTHSLTCGQGCDKHKCTHIPLHCRRYSSNSDAGGLGILRSASGCPFTKKPQDLLSQQAKRALGFSESFTSESGNIIGCCCVFTRDASLLGVRKCDVTEVRFFFFQNELGRRPGTLRYLTAISIHFKENMRIKHYIFNTRTDNININVPVTY